MLVETTTKIFHLRVCVWGGSAPWGDARSTRQETREQSKRPRTEEHTDPARTYRPYSYAERAGGSREVAHG